jgi:hypothetical protein
MANFLLLGTAKRKEKRKKGEKKFLGAKRQGKLGARTRQTKNKEGGETARAVNSPVSSVQDPYWGQTRV